MAAIVNSISLFCLGFAIISLSSLCLTDAQKSGFSVEFIHRDSPKSPLYNPLESTYDRLSNALHRSFTRANRFKSTSVSTKAVETNITPDGNVADYLMKVSIGTPALDIFAVADTGSDLIWTQCKPCSRCYAQDAPLFDPSNSSTYKTVSCNASECKNVTRSVDKTSCSSNKTCEYSITYGDSSFSTGDVATDTLTLPSTDGSSVAFPETIIGCGHNNNGTFDEKTTGIIGLGGGNVSLISQMGDTIAGKFSYCLLPPSDKGDSSKMNFGSNAIVSGNGVVSTPLFKKDPYTFYFLNLEAVSVGSSKLNFTGSTFGSKDGNIIIDSGTTFTFVPDGFYSKLESTVSSQISATRIYEADPLLCYFTSDDFTVPEITVHFTNADVKLQPLNTFAMIADGVTCLTFIPAGDFAIYGNLAQMNILVGYDTENQTVSFMPTDCSKVGPSPSPSTSSASSINTWMMPLGHLISVVLQIAACIMMIVQGQSSTKNFILCCKLAIK